MGRFSVLNYWIGRFRAKWTLSRPASGFRKMLRFQHGFTQKSHLWSLNHPNWFTNMFTGLVYNIESKTTYNYAIQQHKSSSNITSQTLKTKNNKFINFQIIYHDYWKESHPYLISANSTAKMVGFSLPSSSPSFLFLLSKPVSKVFTWKCFSPFFFLLLQKYLSFLFSPNSLNFY